jgi:hypothetical protein
MHDEGREQMIFHIVSEIKDELDRYVSDQHHARLIKKGWYENKSPASRERVVRWNSIAGNSFKHIRNLIDTLGIYEELRQKETMRDL